jgi:hypothetical protein
MLKPSRQLNRLVCSTRRLIVTAVSGLTLYGIVLNVFCG